MRVLIVCCKSGVSPSERAAYAPGQEDDGTPVGVWNWYGLTLTVQQMLVAAGSRSSRWVKSHGDVLKNHTLGYFDQTVDSSRMRRMAISVQGAITSPGAMWVGVDLAR